MLDLCYIVFMDIIKGKMAVGKGIGKTMGFPTINIPYDGALEGVFSARVFCADKAYVAAVNVGARPTFDDEEKLCEVFILNLEDDVSFEIGDEFEVELVEKIREIRKFSGIEELKEQIAKDVDFVKMTLC